MFLGEDIEKEHGCYNNFVKCQERDVEKVKKDTGLVFEPFFFSSINPTRLGISCFFWRENLCMWGC